MLSREYFVRRRTNMPRSPSQIWVCFQKNTQSSCNLHQFLFFQDYTHTRRRGHDFYALKRLFCWMPYKYAPIPPSQICVCFQNTQNSCNLHQSLVSQDTHSRRHRHIFMLSRDYIGCSTNMPRSPSQISVGKICDETDAQAGALRRAWRRSADAPSRRGGPGGRALSPSVLEQRVAALRRKA